MSNGLENLPQYIKRGLAATLFTVMLVGSARPHSPHLQPQSVHFPETTAVARDRWL